MKAVAHAHKNRNLQEFETTLATYTNELNNDPIIRTQLAALYDTLLEQNLVRIIEPFSRVEISHIADMVKLPTQQVEAKLSQMILDKKFHGILDQGAGCLIVFDEPEEDKTYETAVETLKQVDKVVSSLYQKVIHLNDCVPASVYELILLTRKLSDNRQPSSPKQLKTKHHSLKTHCYTYKNK
jgi:26S proteasome regulatory subunit N6